MPWNLVGITPLKPKEQYILLCENEDTIPVFQTAWWLDAVVGRDNWEVVLHENEGQIIGAMPYFIKSKWGFKIITMPRFISMMGIWIKYPINQKYIDKLHYEQQITKEIINQLPRFDYFNQSFYHTFSNWLPFHWKNFQETTRYTYILENISDSESILKNFTYNKRKKLLSSEKTLLIKEDLPAIAFYKFHRNCLQNEGVKIDYPFSLLESLIKAAHQRRSGKIIYAVDNQNKIHSALFVVWNKASAFAVINPIDTTISKGGASSLLVWEMIKQLKNKTTKFDFDGSMNEHISDSFRRFGAVQKPYFVISKTNSLLIKLYRLLMKH